MKKYALIDSVVLSVKNKGVVLDYISNGEVVKTHEYTNISLYKGDELTISMEGFLEIKEETAKYEIVPLNSRKCEYGIVDDCDYIEPCGEVAVVTVRWENGTELPLCQHHLGVMLEEN